MKLPYKLKNNKYIDPIINRYESLDKLNTIGIFGLIKIYRVYSWSLKSYKQYNIIINNNIEYKISINLLNYLKQHFYNTTYFILPFYLDKIYFMIHDNSLYIIYNYQNSQDAYSLNSPDYITEKLIEKINIIIDKNELTEYITQFINVYNSNLLLNKL